MDFFAMAFRPAGGHLPKLFFNFSLTVGNLSPASFNLQTNIRSQGKNSPALLVLVILYKILKSGAQHWKDHISVKYWSILKVYEIFEIRISWASQIFFLIQCAMEAEKKQSVQSVSWPPLQDYHGKTSLFVCCSKVLLEKY